MNGSLLGFSVLGILQARILEWVAISFSKGMLTVQGSNLSFLYLLHRRQVIYPLNHFTHLPIYPLTHFKNAIKSSVPEQINYSLTEALIHSRAQTARVATIWKIPSYDDRGKGKHTDPMVLDEWQRKTQVSAGSLCLGMFLYAFSVLSIDGCCVFVTLYTFQTIFWKVDIYYRWFGNVFLKWEPPLNWCICLFKHCNLG